MAQFTAFYSYKGGVGRSLALANVAWSLAHRGRRVLVIDMDLEAPSIHATPAFYRPDGVVTGGLVEFADHYARTGRCPDLDAYVYDIEGVPAPGALKVLPAGRLDGGYQAIMHRLRWSFLHPELGSDPFVEQLRARVEATVAPDYVLIDSRTGFSDVGGLSTHRLADTVVLVTNLTRACIDGTVRAYRSMEESRKPTRPLFYSLVAGQVPAGAEEDGSVVSRRLRAAAELMPRAADQDRPVIQVHYDPKMVLADDLAVQAPARFDAAAAYERLRHWVQWYNPHDVYCAEDEARQARERGDVERAVARVRSFVEEHPGDASGQLALARLLIELGRHRDALPYAETAFALAPTDWRAQWALGECKLSAIDALDFEEVGSEPGLSTVPAEDSGDALVGPATSAAEQRARAREAALEHLERARTLGGNAPGLYTALIDAYTAVGNVAMAAHTRSEKIVRVLNAPDESPVLAHSSDEYIEALAARPPYPGFSAQEFWTRTMGSLSLSEQEKRRILKTAVDGSITALQFRELIRILREEEEKWTEFWGESAQVLLARVAEASSGTSLEELLRLRRGDSGDAVVLAFAFATSGSEDLALIREAAALAPDDPKLLRKLATMLLGAARKFPEEAIELTETAAQLGRKACELAHDAPSLTLLGHALVERSKLAEAEEKASYLTQAAGVLEEAVAADPHHHEAQRWMGWLRDEQALAADGEERTALLLLAIKHLERAVFLEPRDAASLHNWGTALGRLAARAEGAEALKYREAAVDRYRAGLRVRPGDPGTRYALAAALRELAAVVPAHRREAAIAEATSETQMVTRSSRQLARHLSGLAGLASGEQRLTLLQRSRGFWERSSELTDRDWRVWGKTLVELSRLEADAQECLGLRLEAIEKYERSLEIAPTSIYAQDGLSFALLWLAHSQDGDEQRATLQRAAAAAARSSELEAGSGDYNHGCALVRLGEFEDGWPLISRAIENKLETPKGASKDPDLQVLWKARPDLLEALQSRSAQDPEA